MSSGRISSLKTDLRRTTLRISLPQHPTVVIWPHLLRRIQIAALGRTLLISLQLVLQMLLLRAGLIVQILLQHALLLLLLHLHLICMRCWLGTT